MSMMMRLFLPAVVSILAATASVFAAPVSGETVYQKRCSACHDSANARIPARETLRKLPAARILRALDFGVMMNVASPMTREERDAVATFLGMGAADAVTAPKNYCADQNVTLTSIPKGSWNGWS